jgi:hypothetical protein
MTLELLNFLVIIQSVFVLGAGFFSLFLSKKKNFVFFSFCTVFFLLVCGQNLWLIQKFFDNNDFSHYYQYLIDKNSLYLASYFSIGFSFIVFLTYFFMTLFLKNKSEFTQSLYMKNLKFIKYDSQWLGNIISLAFVMIGGLLLIQLLGGISSALGNPGQIVEGQSAALFLILIGKFPLLYKIFKKQNVNIFEILLFLVSLIFIIINSRFLAIFVILQTLLLIHYKVKRINIRIFTLSFSILVSLVFVFGIYRDSGNYTNSSELRLESIISRILDVNSTIDWFYSTNIEGFLGLSGIISYQSDHGSFRHDYGLSNLAYIGNLIPKNIQGLLGVDKILSEFKNMYPYSNFTVVPSGLEVAYASFNVFGIFLLAFFMGFCLCFFDYLLKKFAQNQSMLGFFLILTLTPHMVALLRTSPGISIFFMVPDLMICFFYYQIQRIVIYRKHQWDSKIPDDLGVA